MLSPDQITDRRSRLGGSDMRVLMVGSAQDVYRLWQEKRGEVEPEDLSRVWAVRLGEATEQLSLDWYEQKSGSIVTRRGEVTMHPDHAWFGVTLDGWDSALNCPLEVKHCGGREPIDIVIERYQPQLQAIMACTGTETCGLSVIMGASEPVVEYLECDDAYVTEMIRRGTEFWRCVITGEAPVDLPPVPAPIIANRTYDFSENNQWCSEAFAWLENRAAAEKCKDAEKLLKSLVPEDAKKVVGAGIYISRDRVGRLSLRAEK